jgi:hypothetical protein
MKKVLRMWLGIALGGLVGLVIVVFVVGSLLPSVYAAKGRLDVALPPQDVWRLVSDFEKHPLAAKMARSVERLPDEDGRAVWKEDLGSSVVTVRTVEAREPERLVRRMQDSVVPMSADWTLSIEPRGAGSRLWIENRTEIRRGTWHVPIFRLIMTVSRGAERGVEAYLKQIGGELGQAAVAWE